MVFHDALVALPSRAGCTARAHGHEVLGDILRLDAVYEDEPEQVLEVGSHPIACVEGTAPLIHLLAAIERRMRRHESQSHHPSPERSRTIISHAFRQVLVVHVVYVAIHRIQYLRVLRVGLPALRFLLPLPHCPGDAAQGIVRGIEVIRVEDADYITRGHLDALVHGIIDTVVGFADISQPPLEERFEFPHHLHGVVLRSPIYDQQLIVTISLCQHAFQGVGHRIAAIISSGNDRDFHQK